VPPQLLLLLLLLGRVHRHQLQPKRAQDAPLKGGREMSSVLPLPATDTRCWSLWAWTLTASA